MAAPGLVAGVRRYIALTAGTAHTCAIAADSTAWCWGANGDGQLGDGTRQPRATPAAVSGGHKFVVLSAGGRHTCGVKSRGELFCWGANDDGQLGDGTTDARPAPTAITASIAGVSAGTNHTCAVATNLVLACWGGNEDGQLGDSTTARRVRGVGVRGAGGFRATAVSAGERFTCALSPAAELYCWGRNADGQLGAPRSVGERSITPFRVGQLRAVAVAAGREHACAIQQDGRGACWGKNATGQLGNGSTAAAAGPATVAGAVFRR